MNRLIEVKKKAVFYIETDVFCETSKDIWGVDHAVNIKNGLRCMRTFKTHTESL